MSSTHWAWMRNRQFRVGVRVFFGVFFLVLGVLGIFLPILQGLIFLALGLALLAPHVPFIRRLRDRMYSRYPRTERFVAAMRRRFSWLHRHREE